MLFDGIQWHSPSKWILPRRLLLCFCLDSSDACFKLNTFQAPKSLERHRKEGSREGIFFSPKDNKASKKKDSWANLRKSKRFFCLVAMLMESRHAKYMWWLDWEKGKVVPEIYWNFPIKCTFMSKWHSKTGSHITTSNNSEHDILDRHEISFYFLLCLSVFQILPSKLGIQHSRCVVNNNEWEVSRLDDTLHKMSHLNFRAKTINWFYGGNSNVISY